MNTLRKRIIATGLCVTMLLSTSAVNVFASGYLENNKLNEEEILNLIKEQSTEERNEFEELGLNEMVIPEEITQKPIVQVEEKTTEVVQETVEKDAINSEETTGDAQWVTVDGIEGGQILFDSSTGTITDCETSVTIANIPSEIDGVNVTEIGSWAFYDCNSLTEVTIPDSVTEIGESAFRSCNSLTEVTIPDSVTRIGSFAFYYCRSLTEATIPDNVTVIEHSAFNRCSSLTEVTIPDSVTVIEHSAFGYCDSLTSVTIPDNVTLIRGDAFEHCSSLESITVGKNNLNYSSENGVFFNKDKTELVQYPARKTDKTYIIPNSVTQIGSSAFWGCSSLTSVTIPDSVIKIHIFAFLHCSSLTEVTIPDSVTWIGHFVFGYCSSLESITVGKNNSNYSSENGVLFNKAKTELIQYPERKTDKTYIIPNSVTEIYGPAFENCSSLTSVTIPDSVTEIDSVYEFHGCSSLESITVDSNNLNYSSEDGILFNKDKTELIQYPARKTDKTYIIPNSVTQIDSSAFSGCSSLTSVTIPDSVTWIGGDVFENCSSLTDIYYKGTEEQWSEIFIGNRPIPWSVKIHFNNESEDIISHEEKFMYVENVDNEYVYFNEYINGKKYDSKYKIEDFEDASNITDWKNLIGKYVVLKLKYINVLSITPQSVTVVDEIVFSKIHNLTTNKVILDNVTYNQNIITRESEIDDFMNHPEFIRNSDELVGNSDDIYGVAFVLDGEVVELQKLNMYKGMLESYNPQTKVISIRDKSTKTISDYALEKEYLINDLSSCVDYNVWYLEGEEYLSRQFFGVVDTNSEFHSDIYMSNYLINNHKNNELADPIWRNSLTPGAVLIEESQEGGFETSAAIWDSVTGLFDEFDDPSTQQTLTESSEDIYSAIIFDAISKLENSETLTSQIQDTLDIGDRILGEGAIVNDALKLATDDVFIQLLLEIGISMETPLKDLPSSSLSELKKYFNEKFKLVGEFSNVLVVIDSVLDYSVDLIEFVNNICYFAALMNLNDSIKQVINQMYVDCPSNNPELKKALKNCNEVMEQSFLDLLIDIQKGLLKTSGENAVKGVFKVVWNSTSTVMKAIVPAVAVIMYTYSAAKFITEGLFATSDIIEAYYKVVSTEDLHRLACTAYDSLQSRFENDETVSNAQAYIASIDLVYAFKEVSADNAYQYVDVVENAGINSIKEFFWGKDAEYEEAKSDIQIINKSFQDSCFSYKVSWMFSLEDEYPNSGLGEKYDSIYHELFEDRYGFNPKDREETEITVKCPVDVYVYDKNNNLVASIIDNDIKKITDSNITGLVINDIKTLYIQNEENYRIEYIGNDVGVMDITVNKYNQQGELINTKEFYELEVESNKKYNSSVNELELISASTNENIEPNVNIKEDTIKYELEIKNGIATINDNSTILAQVVENQKIKISSLIPEGYEFVSWESNVGDSIFENINDKDTTITVPNKNIEIIANIVPIPKIGDVNLDGNVNIIDSLAIMQYLAKIQEFTEIQLINADVTGDGVDIQDALTIQFYIAKTISEFPVENK